MISNLPSLSPPSISTKARQLKKALTTHLNSGHFGYFRLLISSTNQKILTHYPFFHQEILSKTYTSPLSPLKTLQSLYPSLLSTPKSPSAPTSQNPFTGLIPSFTQPHTEYVRIV
ncbi:unnamed protein product [Moneuplotes crassus]|uniref:Uncharacterized protein n=1 Tax=Euplotes crassus TaxID=5936 RepID=A0AAD1Y3Y9_EUPCR|nr:unnamed protein product [Moneuplotes crassus]